MRHESSANIVMATAACISSMITMSTEYMPSSHLLFHPTPASPVAAVRNVNSPAPPKAKMNLHPSVAL